MTQEGSELIAYIDMLKSGGASRAQQMSWAFDLPAGAVTTSERLVLLVIGYHADDAGECRPGFGQIAREAGLSTAVAAWIVKRLEAKGYVEGERDKDGNRSSSKITRRFRIVTAHAPRGNAKQE